MGESPDRVLRDGGRERDQERERTGSTASAAADPAAGTAESPERGSGAAAAGASAAADAEATAADEDSSDTAAGPSPDGSAEGSAESSAETASKTAGRAGGKTSGGTPAKASADAPAAGAKGGSTVQLRVRDVDSKTTMLRLPVDNKTTALRLPEGLVKGADSGSSADQGDERKSSSASGGVKTSAERPSGADPRLAIRTTEDVDAEAAQAAEAARKTGAAAAKTDPARKVEKAGDSKGPGDSKDSKETGDSKDTEDTEAASAEAAPADSEPATLTTTGQPGQKPGPTGKLEKPEPPRPAAAPTAGTVPEPPAPRPLPEPEPAPGPEPLPKPAPKPEPGPAPAPEPLPEPDPRPVPPVPPLPRPEPMPMPEPEPESPPSPENTAEAMEVLASLNARPVSPLRRALKRVTIWTVFLAVVLGAVVVAQLLRPLPDATVKMTATGSYTFSGDQLDLAWPAKGQSVAEVVGVGSLGSSGQEAPAPIASVTKVMNAYLILQKFPLKKGESGPKITVDPQAAQESGNGDESRVALTAGQVLTEYQALELLMLPSANNVARLLARYHSGSEEAFVKLMNDTAAKFGMTNTIYADPAGYSPDTKSTAKDQLKLGEQVMQDEIFRQIVSTPETNFNNAKIRNTNTLINPKTGVIGVKTGSSTPAGGCLMWAAYKEIGGVKRLILGVTLGQPATSPREGDGILDTVLKVSGKQIQAAQNGVTGQTVVKKGDVVGSVDDGLGGKVRVVATQDLVVAGFPGISGTVSLDAAKIRHNEQAGKEVGVLRVGAGENKVEVPVALQSDLKPPSIQSRLLRTL
ncbi:D-alanyl-D-alanine carboxypeptidase [Streptomyces sp. NRRL S-350]|uniref:D-alanyl-D-alanine carboxypeptidase n=1 Tax=Streptomyces sp. NRRL S-350 TaxID=1463902 RepID=UPI00068999AB|nr:D-alanyl-D-alanine carboxypeptidase [Streptomyces sp. NRRL S-350]